MKRSFVDVHTTRNVYYNEWCCVIFGWPESVCVPVSMSVRACLHAGQLVTIGRIGCV